MEGVKKWLSERTAKKNGMYVHYSPPKVVGVVSAAQLRQWARGGAESRLERAVLAGQGHRLLAEAEALPMSHHLPTLVAKCDALHAAVEKGSLLELQELLEADYNRRKFVTCCDEAGVGLLHKAVFYDYMDIAQWLVKNYPQLVHQKDSEGRTPLHYVAVCRDEAATAALLEGAGAAKGARDAAGRTPAHYRGPARALLALPVTDDMARETAKNPPGLVIKRHNIRIWCHDCDMARLQRVVWEGHGARLLSEVSSQPVVKRFLEAVPYIMNTIRDIHTSVIDNDMEGLMKHSGDPVPPQALSSRDANFMTVMHKAAGLGHSSIMKYIAERYPQGINDVDNDGRTPLHYAAAVRDDQHTYNMLVDFGADESAVDNKNRTPAYYTNRPQEIDKNTFKTLPEAPRTPSSAYPSSWDWKLLDTEVISELHKKSRRRNLRASNENISSKNDTNTISESTDNRNDGVAMKASNTHEFIKDLPELDESSQQNNDEVEDHDGKATMNEVENEIHADNIDNNKETEVIEDDENNREDQDNEEEQKHQSVGHAAEDAEETLNQIEESENNVDDKGENDQETTNDTQENIESIENDLQENKNSNEGTEEIKAENDHNKNKTNDTHDNTSAENAQQENENSIKDTEEVKSENDSNKKEANDTHENTKSAENTLEENENSNEATEEVKAENNHNRNETPVNENKETNGLVQKDDVEVKSEITLEYLQENNVDKEPQESNDCLEYFQNEVSKVESDVVNKETSKSLVYNQENHDEQNNNSKEEIQDISKEKIKEHHNSYEEFKEDKNYGDETVNINEKEIDDAATNKGNITNNRNEDDDDVQVQGDSHSEYSDFNLKSTAEVSDSGSAKRGNVINGRNTQESLIEGIISGEAEQDSQDASITEREEYVYGEVLVVDNEIDPEVTDLINSANMEMLATLVLNGEGSRLIGRGSRNLELQGFLDNVPTYMQKINQVHVAAREGNLKNLQAALDRRKFAIARDLISPNGATPLHVATVFGKTNIMKYLGGRFPETLSAVDFEGRTALHYAAVLPDNGHYYNLLQQLGANSKDVDDNGKSAEDYYKNPCLLPFDQLLSDYGINGDVVQNMFSDKGNSHVDNGHMDIPIFRTEEGRYLAKSLGDPLIKGLTEVANIKPKDPVAFLASFLHNFPEHEKPRLGTQESNMLVARETPEMENEAPPESAPVSEPISKTVRSAARTAIRPRPIEVVTVDPQQITSPDAPEIAFSSAKRDEHGQSMLHFAAARTHARNALFQLLQESDISLGYRDELYRTARDVSSQANVPENTVEIDKWVLHLAARDNTEKIMGLVMEGYDHILDVVDEEGVLISDVISQRGHNEMSSMLASIPTFEESRETLHGAVRRGDLEAVEKTLAADGGLTVARSQNSFGRTALHVAVLAEHEEVVAYLAQTCPELLRIGDNLERTPLHYAMGVEKIESLSRVLIRAGAKRVLKDLKGRQPSYYFMNKSDILRLKEEEENY